MVQRGSRKIQNVDGRQSNPIRLSINLHYTACTALNLSSPCAGGAERPTDHAATVYWSPEKGSFHSEQESESNCCSAMHSVTRCLVSQSHIPECDLTAPCGVFGHAVKNLAPKHPSHLVHCVIAVRFRRGTSAISLHCVSLRCTALNSPLIGTTSFRSARRVFKKVPATCRPRIRRPRDRALLFNWRVQEAKTM